MRILLIGQYFWPETIGAAHSLHQLATDLRSKGHEVQVLTGFPNYPEGVIFEGYRGKVFLRETVDGVDVIRTYIYASPNRSFWRRILNFGSFCASAMLGGLAQLPRADVVYAVLPPLPLGVSGWVLAKACRARLVVNLQDIYPEIAVDTGFLRNRWAISFFEWMERWVYAQADRIVVISRGFRQNLLAKGVAAEKIAVISNWADPRDFIGSRAGRDGNRFRVELGVNNEFVVLYSGGLTLNSHLEPVLDAANRLSSEPFLFVIAGEGVRKEELMRKADALRLANVRFLPFQPLERYAETLAAADITLVTLNAASTFASVPSKIYKQMAAGRPIVAITNPGNELTRLVEDSRCGVCLGPDDVDGLAQVLREAIHSRERFEQMGRNGRAYLERECSRTGCVSAIEETLRDTIGRTG